MFADELEWLEAEDVEQRQSDDAPEGVSELCKACGYPLKGLDCSCDLKEIE